MTSLLRPDPRMLKLLGGFSELGKVVREVPVTTRRLDDIGEIGALDFLKIDVQGSELAVFRHGSRRLAEAVAVQTEVSFLPLYEQQPLFSDVDLELRRLGFVPHAFAAVKKWMISPLTIPNKPFAAFNQLLEADVVYVRDFSQPEEMSGEQLKHLAIIAHHCYRSFDLVANCLQHLRTRSEVAQDALASYLRLLAPEATRPGRNE
jgi:hypothetical protein